LAHAKRIRLHGLGPDLVETDSFDDVAHSLPTRGLHTVSSRCVEDLEVPFAGQERIERRTLDERAHSDQRGGEVVRHAVAEDLHRAARRMDQPEQHPDGSRLAGAVRAEEPEQISFVDVEIDVIDGSQPARERLRQRVRRDDAHVDPAIRPAIRSSSATVTVPAIT
jgi:hypothetical protein